MGRSITPTFRVEFKMKPGFGYLTPWAWDTKHAGRPTNTNLERFMEMVITSFQSGVNKDVYDGQLPVVSVRVIRQSNNEVVATWEAK